MQGGRASLRPACLISEPGQLNASARREDTGREAADRRRNELSSGARWGRWVCSLFYLSGGDWLHGSTMESNYDKNNGFSISFPFNDVARFMWS